jgi:predicted SpoU family rRNA methylase
MLMDGKEFELEFEGGKLEVVPSAEGKQIITHEEPFDD